MKNKQRIFIIFIMLAASWQLASAAYIHVKAYVAQQLLLSAWEKTLQGDKNVKPWSWSDTWPVARMQVPAHKKDMVILAGDSGRNLAFAPGYRFGSAKPGEQGISMISAHRDTHFKFLQYLKTGDEIKILTDTGRPVYYSVSETRVVNHRSAEIDLNKTGKELLLVTCYPFNSVSTDTELRYLVYAKQTFKPSIK